jgi:lipopolysaccharide export system permease protein
LTSVEVFEFSPAGEFETRIDAASMRLESKRWKLTDVVVSSPNAPTAHAETYYLATDLTPDQVGQALASADTVPFWSLAPTANLASRAGVDPGPYRLRFQELLARPLLLAAMALLAGCFSLRFFRSGGIGLMLSGGAASGFVLYIISKLSSEFGGAGLLSPLAAGWSPAILACVVSGTALLYLEDG